MVSIQSFHTFRTHNYLEEDYYDPQHYKKKYANYMTYQNYKKYLQFDNQYYMIINFPPYDYQHRKNY